MTRGFGRIVFTTSAAVYGAQGNMAYAAAKAGIVGLMRCLAVEGRPHDIAVNAIAPSASTRMTDRFLTDDYGRWFHQEMSPEKAAVAAAYLVHEDCGINGEILALGGGRIARIALAESEGAFGACGSIEEVAAAIPEVMAQQPFFYSADLTERSSTVARLFASAPRPGN